MGAGERECRLTVIEGRRYPCRGRMAARAIMRESVGDMIGVGNPAKVGLVTSVTVGRRPGIAGGVALNARHRLVCPS